MLIQVVLVGGSFLVAAFQYSVEAVGGVSFHYTSAPRWLRRICEGLLWFVSIEVLILVLICVVVDPTLWPVCTAAGLVAVAASNIILGRIRAQIDRQIRTTGAPDWYRVSRIVRYRRYDILDYWMPTLIGYTILSVMFAVADVAGWAHDYMIYAVTICAVNLLVFSYSQVTRQGPDLRSNLVQYVVAGEHASSSA